MSVQRVLSTAPLVTLVVLLGASVSSALATVGWAVHSVADPTSFAPNGATECQSLGKCDRYQVIVLNTGDTASSGPVTVTDTLEGETEGYAPESGRGPGGEKWTCALGASPVRRVTCTLSEAVAAGAYAPVIGIRVSPPTSSSGSVSNEVTVSGGGAIAAATANETTEISAATPSFDVSGFDFQALSPDGSASDTAGGHPGTVVAHLDFPDIFSPPNTGSPLTPVAPVEEVKNLVVELPAGMLGDPLATPKCPQYDEGVEPGEEGNGQGLCSTEKSAVGAVAFGGGASFRLTGELQTSPIYNIIPEAGYPAEFSFSYAGNGVNMYAGVVHTPSGYRLRVAAPGIPTVVQLTSVYVAFFGEPAAHNGASGQHTAFLTNPADCSQGPVEAKVEADSWEHPETWVSKTTVSYPQIEDCNLLQFEPKLQMAPAPSTAEGEGSSQADEPSAYDVNLEVPQRTLFEETRDPGPEGRVRDAA